MTEKPEVRNKKGDVFKKTKKVTLAGIGGSAFVIRPIVEVREIN